MGSERDEELLSSRETKNTLSVLSFLKIQNRSDLSAESFSKAKHQKIGL